MTWGVEVEWNVRLKTRSGIDLNSPLMLESSVSRELENPFIGSDKD